MHIIYHLLLRLHVEVVYEINLYSYFFARMMMDDEFFGPLLSSVPPPP